jgi:hypothetical protein
MAPFGRQALFSGAARRLGRNTRFVPGVQGSEFFPEVQERRSFICVLTPKAAARSHDSGRKVCEADPTFRGVLMLSSLTTGTKHIDPALTEQLRVG